MPFRLETYQPGSLADLIAAPGRARAQALRAAGEARQRAQEFHGQNAANLAGNIGQIASRATGELIDYQQRAPERQFRAMQAEHAQLQNRAMTQEATGQAKERAILPFALKKGPNGVATYDRDVLTREFTAAGIGDRLPNLLKGLDVADESAFKVAEAKREAFAGLAYGVISAGATPDVFNRALEYAVENGLASKQEISELIQAVGDDPQRIGQVAHSIASGSKTFAGLMETARGHRATEAQTAATQTAVAADRAADNARAVTTAAEASRHNRAMEGRPTGATAPVSVIGPDGKPVYVRPQDAIGRTPASGREQGRPVTSGDANRIAELDTSLNDLAALSSTLSETAKATGTAAKIGASLPNPITEFTGWGEDAKKRQGVIDRVKQVIGKALEGGVLRKEDEYKYTKILPTIGDTQAVAASKLEGLRKALVLRRETTLEALADANYDTSKFTNKGPAPRPASDPLGLFE